MTSFGCDFCFLIQRSNGMLSMKSSISTQLINDHNLHISALDGLVTLAEKIQINA